MKCKTFSLAKKILLAMFIFISMFGELSFFQPCAMADCMPTREEALNWLYAQEGVWHDLDDKYGAQCSDFASAYMNWLYSGYSNPNQGYLVYDASYYPTVASWNPDRWGVFGNTSDFSPEPGDIYVQPGHVGVFLSGSKDYATVIDQNSWETWALADQYGGYGREARIYSTNISNATNFIRYNYYSDRAAGNNSAPQQPGYAATGPVLPDGDYIIAAMADPHYYLDIDGAESPAAPGTNVHLWYSPDGNIGDYDAWTVRYENGFYRISQRGQNVSLDVDNESSANGANVQVWINNDFSAQKWTITGSSSTGYRLKALCSNKSLEFENSILAGGTNVQQWADDDVPAQYWVFIPYSSQSSTPASNDNYTNPTASMPNVSFETWNDDRFTYIGETDASIGQRVIVSNGNCTEVGMILYDSYGIELGRAKNPTYEHEKNYFKINEELGVTLRGGSVYQYKFYAVVNGQTVYSSMGSFTTSPSTHSHSYSRTVIYEPTCEDSGYAIDECVICGFRQEVNIPAPGHDYIDGVCSRCGKQNPNQANSLIAYIAPGNWRNWPAEVIDTAPASEEDQSTSFKFQMPTGIKTIWNSVSGVLGSR